MLRSCNLLFLLDIYRAKSLEGGFLIMKIAIWNQKLIDMKRTKKAKKEKVRVISSS